MKTKDITTLYQDAKLTDWFGKPSLSGVYFSFMDPIFSYLNGDPEAKLHQEQYGENSANQSVIEHLKVLEASWGKCYEEMKSSKKKKKNAYCKNLLVTFKSHFYVELAHQMGKLIFELLVMSYSKQFFEYLEAKDSFESPTQKGVFLVLAIIIAQQPLVFFNGPFAHALNCWVNRLLRCQTILLYNKNLRVSPATNKSISTGKFLNIMLQDTSAVQPLFQVSAELIKSGFVLFIGMVGLYKKIGSYCFLPIFFNLIAVVIFMMTNKWRKRSETATETATDARVNELNSSLKNIKVLKLYGW